MRIKELLKQRGMTAKELAEKLNLSSAALSQSLNGNPTLERLTQIADCLGVPVSELFEDYVTDKVTIRCPHCGNPITLKAEK